MRRCQVVRLTSNMATTMKLCLVVSVLLWAAVISIEAAKSKYVSINLSSKWKTTPLMLEASEFLAKESNDYFWGFVNDIGDLEPGSFNIHDESLYQTALKFAGKYLSTLQINLLKFALSLRAHSPTVQMYNSIAHEKNPPENCDAFIDINNIITCEKAALSAFIKAAAKQPKPTLIKNDHHYSGIKDVPVTVILYAQIGSVAFHEFHLELKKLAENGEIDYVIRHYIKNAPDEPVRLSGYGVELAIKSTEYKAKDDTKVHSNKNGDQEEDEQDADVEGLNFKTLKELHPSLSSDLDAFREHLLETSSEMAPLKVWQLQDLSFQASQRIMNTPSGEQLKVLRDLSQNFPVMARSLTKMTVDEDLRKEIQKNQKYFEQSFGMQPGESALFINGLQADLDIYDVFTLLENMKDEAKLMSGLYSLGITGDQLVKMLKLDFRENNKYAVDIRDSSVKYINDLEKDRRYANWPSSMQDLLRPTFPGMLRHVRKNFFHMVFFVDPADHQHKTLLKMAEAFYVHNAPIRIGIVFVVDDTDEADATKDAGVAMARAFSYIEQEEGGAFKALSFVTDVYENINDGDEGLTATMVIEEFKNSFSDVDYDEVFTNSKAYDKWRKNSSAYFKKTGLGSTPQVLLNGIPIPMEDLSADSFEEAVVTHILQSTPELQKAVYNGDLFEGMDVLDYLMSKPNVMPRLNSRILSSAEQFLDFTSLVPSSAMKQPASYAELSTPDMTAAMLSSMEYVAKKDEDAVRSVTLWVVADLETPEGRDLLYHTIKGTRNSLEVRISVIHNPKKVPAAFDTTSHFISRAIQVALQTQSPAMARSFVTKLLKQENVDALKKKEKTLDDLAVNNMEMKPYNEALEKSNNNVIIAHSSFCERVLDFKPGQRGVIANGKLLGPLRDDEDLLPEDFTLLEKYTSQSSASKIAKQVKTMFTGSAEDSISDMVLRVSSLLLSKPQDETRKEVDYHGDRHSVISLPPESDGPAYDVVAILDPLSRAAQKYIPFIIVLQQVANVNIRVFMNSREKLSEMPLKSFYRYVLEPEVSFAVDSSLASSIGARFHNIPEKPLFTLGMDPPESWLVEAVSSPYDLDNIFMEEVDTAVHAEFELEYVLLEGHCYDSSTGQPPRGLQFILGTNSTPAQVDTIVMANLGYFQLKASPGAWILGLRQGRSQEIYDIISHEHTDSPSESQEVIVVIDSFKSKIIKIKVNKKPGMEHEDLLGGANGNGGGLWDSISSYWKKHKIIKPELSEEEEIKRQELLKKQQQQQLEKEYAEESEVEEYSQDEDIIDEQELEQDEIVQKNQKDKGPIERVVDAEHGESPRKHVEGDHERKSTARTPQSSVKSLGLGSDSTDESKKTLRTNNRMALAKIYDLYTGFEAYAINTAEEIKLEQVVANPKKAEIAAKAEEKAGVENEERKIPYVTPLVNLLKKFGGTETEEKKEEVINIFSVASGHLYERLLRIMVLSVLKNTQSKVKFWFLKNYLSPTFKDFIPQMAKKYDFEYELVQYKWPRWLHQQTEKQRIIWGYKILFLDVLFPLDVQKIIFVDADQIVRTDLQELVDIDLEGAPYGYTPFCDSRTEMDGFRFWKSGYWASHLAGRRYHISALYVVDLQRFRRIAAGDRLRGQYQGLSQDPNSLSNLDQDLPNNMIHQVAIKSLPQEWLWCETWCSDKEKTRAKTIDLCNNPLTKEPKLSAARRIVPEWTDYDNEVQQLWDSIYHTGGSVDAEEPSTKESSQTKHTGDKKDEL